MKLKHMLFKYMYNTIYMNYAYRSELAELYRSFIGESKHYFYRKIIVLTKNKKFLAAKFKLMVIISETCANRIAEFTLPLVCMYYKCNLDLRSFIIQNCKIIKTSLLRID
jgi:hypothetical protein